MSSSTPGIPSTSDYVRFHALHRPGAIALIEGARKIDYATFDRDLGRFTRALREFGLPRGGFVAVAWEGGVYVHWLLLLACENLGLATASFLPAERGALPRLFDCVQLVLSEDDLPEAGAKGRRLTREWLKRVRSSPPPGDGEGAVATPMGLADPLRIRRSSGTTGGSPKLMVTTRGYEEQRMDAHLHNLGFTPHSKYLVSTPFTVGIMYTYATLCLRLGATCISAGGDAARVLAQREISHARLYQFEIPKLLDRLPADFRKPADLTVIMSSAPVSRALWQTLTARLASRIIYQYSTNEVGQIAVIGEDGIGTVRTGVDIEVVDDSGVAVPAGQIGEFRVRVAHMVDRYLGDAEASAHAFRDGWFHPGDVGMLLPSGQLKLVGRTDDVLNIGGLKFTPAQIEEIAAQAAPVEDVGVTARPNAQGIEEVCIALVLADGKKLQESADRIRKKLPASLGRMHFFTLNRIPRTAETGKVRRAELKKLLSPK